VHNIASNGGSVAGVGINIPEYLLTKELCAHWVPKVFMFEEKVHCCAVPAEHLHQIQLEGNIPIMISYS
jgi:hypothetical protein